MAFLPASCEILGITAYGVLVLGFHPIEGLVLGTVLVAIGDGLVIPKMKEFGVRFKGHPMPRLMFTWAPLEASYALTVFGILVGMSAPAHQPDVHLGLLVVGNVLRVIATIAVGAFLGGVAGWLIPIRTALLWSRRQVFSGSAVEAFLMVLSVALTAFGLGGASDHGKELIPMGFSPGSMFQPELLVIVTGSCFASYTEPRLLHEVEGILGGVWVFGQLFLFSMLGSRTTPAIMTQLYRVLPVMLVGLSFRFAGVFFGMTLTMKARGRKWKELLPDVVFCFLSTLPRATIQGALGAVPVTQRFFNRFPQRLLAQEFIFIAARLYIVSMSIVGMILLNAFGPRMLQATMHDPVHERCPTAETSSIDASIEGSHAEDVNSRENSDALLARPRSGDAVQNALETLAEKFSLPPGEVLSMLCHASEAGKDADNHRGHPPFARQNSAPEIDSGHVRCDHLGMRLHSRVQQSVRSGRRRFEPTGKAMDIEDCELALAQFEAAGSLMAAHMGMAAEGL
ncbi:unnamed protein product [Prorocentrum cordatum]|uniref:Cation/H+ exchanger domain-containing protein n=1 Tax=Prorocentrum cordatum TaxID=2364126 RepID=A0ABN9V520_9DINO|nr:unnamed protein product [Polarella glacialis]